MAEITSEWEGGKQIISDSADELHDAIYLENLPRRTVQDATLGPFLGILPFQYILHMYIQHAVYN